MVFCKFAKTDLLRQRSVDSIPGGCRKRAKSAANGMERPAAVAPSEGRVIMAARTVDVVIVRKEDDSFSETGAQDAQHVRREWLVKNDQIVFAIVADRFGRRKNAIESGAEDLLVARGLPPCAVDMKSMASQYFRTLKFIAFDAARESQKFAPEKNVLRRFAHFRLNSL